MAARLQELASLIEAKYGDVTRLWTEPSTGAALFARLRGYGWSEKIEKI